jgi:hypothetical protein
MGVGAGGEPNASPFPGDPAPADAPRTVQSPRALVSARGGIGRPTKEHPIPYILSTAFIHPGKTERLKTWYRELEHRKAEVLETLENEGVRQEIAFIVPTEHGDMLAVFSESDDPDGARAAFASSPFEIDHKHLAVMDEVTVGGSRGRIRVSPIYAFQNPPG